MEVYEIVEGLLKEENLNVMMAVTDPITFGEANTSKKWREAILA